jgi:hypothetical protein
MRPTKAKLAFDTRLTELLIKLDYVVLRFAYGLNN